MGSLHDLLPRFVDFGKSFGFFGQLFSDVTTDEYSFKVDPHILHKKPSFKDLVSALEIIQPLLDLFSERGVVAVDVKIGN